MARKKAKPVAVEQDDEGAGVEGHDATGVEVDEENEVEGSGDPPTPPKARAPRQPKAKHSEEMFAKLSALFRAFRKAGLKAYQGVELQVFKAWTMEPVRWNPGSVTPGLVCYTTPAFRDSVGTGTLRLEADGLSDSLDSVHRMVIEVIQQEGMQCEVIAQGKVDLILF